MKQKYKLRSILSSAFLLLLFAFMEQNVLAQPAEIAGDINSWATPSLTDRGVVRALHIQAGSNNANSGFKFRSSGSWSPQWGGSTGDYTRAFNTRLSGQAYYSADGSGGWEHNLEFNMTSGNYYTFIIGENTASNNDMSILETSFLPVTISSAGHSPATPNDTETATVTATLSSTLNTGEYAFVRYTTDGWSSSSLAAMSFVSGTDYSATIPVQVAATTVDYYILTSNNNSFSTNDADYFSLEIQSGGSYTVVTVPACAVAFEPTTDANTMAFSSIAYNQMTVGWISGNGANRIIVAKEGSAPTGTPADETDYTANAAYGSGDALGDGFVVYNGNGSSVNVTGLSENTSYYFKVFEYNGDNCVTDGNNYKTDSPLGANQLTPYQCTPASEPTADASVMTFSAVSGTQMDVNWTDGDGAYRVVIAKEGSAPTGTPTDKTTYSASAAFGSGDVIVAGEYVVYNGSGSSVTITGLSVSTTYYFTVFEYNGTGCDASGENYYTSGTPLSGSKKTPLAQISYRGEWSTPTTWTSRMDLTPVTLPTGTIVWVLDYLPKGAGSTNWKFDDGVDWGTDAWFNDEVTETLNQYTVWTHDGSANSAQISTSTNTIYAFTFLDVDLADNSAGAIYDFQSAPVTISAIDEATADGAEYSNYPLAITTSGTPPDNQKFWLRYSTSEDFSSSSFVELTGSGTTYSANIPGAYNTMGKTVHYYAFSTGNLASTPTDANADALTLNYTMSTDYTYIVNTTCSAATEPSTDANTLSFSSIVYDGLTLNWNNGNGTNRIVVASNSAIVGIPADNLAYTADAAFASGNSIAPGEYVIFNGSGNSVTVTGLSESTTYYFKVFEYNGAGCPADGENYKTDSPLSGNQITPEQCPLATTPTTDASVMTFTTVSYNKMTVNWTNGDGTGRIIIAKEGAAPTGTPTNKITYAANATYASGDALGDGFVIYNGSGSSVTVSGLNATATYYYKVFEYNGSGCDVSGENYFTSGTPLEGNKITTAVPALPTLLNSDFINESGTGGAANYTDGWNFEEQFADNHTLITSTGGGDKWFRYKTSTGTIRNPDTNDDPISLNSNTTYTTISDGDANANIISGTNSAYRYVFRTDAGVTKVAVFEIQATYISQIMGISQSPATAYESNDITVTASLDKILPTGQAVYLRYTNNSWVSSTIVKMTGSASSYSGTIPGEFVGVTVQYYVFTSGDVTPVMNTADADFYTIGWDNNGGTNYTYIVQSAPPYETDQDGDWNTAATWLGDVVPPAGADAVIKNAVTINAAVVNAPAIVTVEAGKSITFGAAGDITIDAELINEGTVKMTSGGILRFALGGTFTNNSGFSAGAGEVFFAGSGTVSGTTVFNDVSIAGGVNFGAASSINNILQIYAGGYLNGNGITYNSGSTLLFSGNYIVNAYDKTWQSNTASTGSAQTIPWNVEIGDGFTVDLNDSYEYSINGNLKIGTGSSFRLGTDGSSHWGDLNLRGNFINNGTFTHNDRSVKFIGTAQQQIGGSSNSTFAYLYLSNSAGALLTNSIVVATEFGFASGKLTLGVNNISLGSASLSGYGAGKYFVSDNTGYVVRTVGGTAVDFPVGTTTSYAPAFLTQNGTLEDLKVRVKSGIDNATFNNDFMVNLQWTIDESNADANDIAAKFQWNTTNQNVYFDTNSGVKIAWHNGSGYTKTNASLSSLTAQAAGFTNTAGTDYVVGNDFAFINNGKYTVQNGGWNTPATWNSSTVPTSGQACAILHHVTLSSAPTNDILEKITILSGKSILLDNAASTITADTIYNSGVVKSTNNTASIKINTIFQTASSGSVNMVGGGMLTFAHGAEFLNSGSFTSGTGTVIFEGDGTATGTLGFNDLIIENGDVNLGNLASLNGIMTVQGAGDLVTNGIKYEIESTLKIDRDYTFNDNKLWYRNNEPSSVASYGVPWNIEIATGRIIDIDDTQFRGINGNLNILGTFVLSPSAGGDIKIRGNFTNNGTFTHNNRYIEFNGSSLQLIHGSPSFYDMTINTAANVELASDVSVANDLNLSYGKLILGNFNLTVDNAINTPDATKYIVTNGTGYLSQNVADSEITFPIGTMFAYNPAYLKHQTAGNAENLSVRVQGSIDNALDAPTDAVNVQWTINEAIVGSNDLVSKFQWNASDAASGFDAGLIVQTRYFSGGSYLPASPIQSTIDGSGPWTATAGDVYSSDLADIKFVVANNTAFSCDCYADGTTTTSDWSLATTWTCGHVPGTGESAMVKKAVDLDVDAAVLSVAISSTGSLTCNDKTITLDDGGAIANTINANFDAGTGKVIFSGVGTISTGAITFNDVDLDGAVSFGSNTTIGNGGTISLNSGGSISTNPPVYATGSTLLYNQGGSPSVTNRGSEWQYNIAEGDPGYPANVTIDNNTFLDVDADDNDDFLYQTRSISGNLTIKEGSTISLGNMGGDDADDENKVCGVYAKGDIVNQGTISLSTVIGGDMMLDGNLINTNAAGDGASTINWNGRAIFFTGDQGNNQYVREVSLIPFVLITRGSNVTFDNTQISKTVTIDGAGDEFITFARPSSVDAGSIDLNGHTLISSGNGNIQLNNVAGASVMSSNGQGRVDVSGGNANYTGTSAGTLTFGPNVTLAINGGTMTFPSTLGIVSINGTLEVGDGATITNIPTYVNVLTEATETTTGEIDPTLYYKRSGEFSVNVEWPAGSTTEDNIPHNVYIDGGATAGILNLDLERYAIGELQVKSSGTLNIAPATGWLQVKNLDVEAGGTLVVKSPSDMTAGGSLITTGTVTNSGTMRAERFLTGAEGVYYYVSSPNSSSTSAVFTNGHSGAVFNQNFIKYNEAFDKPIDPISNDYLEWYNGMSPAWEHAHSGEASPEVMTSGKGYAFTTNEPMKYLYDGTFNFVDVDIPITHHDNDGNSGYFDGWNFVGNPYPAALNWESPAWDKSAINGTAYFWDGDNYQYFNGAAGTMANDGAYSVNGATQYIPAMQGFFIQALDQTATGNASTNSYTFTIPKDARLHNNTQDFWKSPTKASNTETEYVKIGVLANGKMDETLIRTNNAATVDFDSKFDAYKMFSTIGGIPQIYTLDAQHKMAINTLPAYSDNTIIPVGVVNTGSKQTDFVFTASTIQSSKQVYLEDTQSGITQNLLANPNYSTTVSKGEITNRFNLIFTDNHAPVAAQIADQAAVYGHVFELAIPKNAFTDSDLGDELSFVINKYIKQSLPKGISFNKDSDKFVGTPSEAGEFELSVTAVDLLGAEATLNFTLTVNKADLTVKADSKTRDFAQANPELTYIFDGLLLDDIAIDIDTQPGVTTTAVSDSPAGNYPISLSGAQDANYNISHVSGTLTVNAILASIQTVDFSDLTETQAKISANITSNGGTTIIGAGICWNTFENPDVTNFYSEILPTESAFALDLTNLLPNTTYFARSFVRNSEGISYGNQIQFTTSEPTAIETIDPEIKISPNPTSGKINIWVPQLNAEADYTITDVAGKRLMQGKLNQRSTQMNLTGLTKGVYFIKIESKDINYSNQIIVK